MAELSSQSALRTAARGRFLIGAALMSQALDDPSVAGLVAGQFDVLTGENEFKPQYLQPEPGRFNFAPADRIVAFAEANGMAVIGHTLHWHRQTPAWMFEAADGKPLPRAQALANLKAHVEAVLEHFHGRIRGWDVVNEAINDRHGEDLRDTPARRAIGDDFVEKAFEFATAAADPAVELYYNDYNIERPEKRERTLRLIRRLKQRGLRIDGVGIQGHWSLGQPPVDMVEEAIVAFHGEGVQVMITELDIDVLPSARQGSESDAGEPAMLDPYRDGLPREIQQDQARRYAELFRLFVRHQDKISRVSFWGVYDGSSWLNNHPIRGRVNHPLLWDRQLQPKPAFEAVLRALE